jgi:hypothetical protein
MLLVDDEPNILFALRRCLAAIDVRQLDGEALRVETFPRRKRRSNAPKNRRST